MVEQPARLQVLLLGDASARPTGLERALTRAGFHLIEREDPQVSAEADAVLITLPDLDEGQLHHLLPDAAAGNSAVPPRLVILARSDPDGPAAALALGAADALVAPVHLPELCARLFARIREHRQASPPSPEAGAAAPGFAPAAGNGGEPQAREDQPSPEQASAVLDQRVQEEFERARRYSLSFSLILLGIDGLRDSDERLGPDAVGRLRDQVARTLRQELRVPDLVVPYGSEEFAIVLPETGQDGARQSLVRVRERLTSLPFEGDPRLEPTRFSAGIVTYPHPAALQTDDLFAMAEAALMRGRAQVGERIGFAM